MLPAIPPETSAARPQAGAARTGCSSAMILSSSVGPAPNSAMSTVLNADFALTRSKRPRRKMRHSLAKARASVVTRNPRAAVADPTSRHDGTEHARSVGGGCARDAQLFHAVAPGLDLAPDACDRAALPTALRPAARNVNRRARPSIPVHTGRPACRPAWARPGFRRGRFVHSCAQAPLPPKNNHSCGCPGTDVAQF
jgi:hypothetical protein